MGRTRINVPIQASPSFFKVLRRPSSSHLALPRAFVRRYLKKICKNIIIKTAKGEHSWRMKFKYVHGDYCFTHGWDQLVHDLDLDPKDFLVFWLIHPSTFKLSVFHQDGCQKDPPSIWCRSSLMYDDEDYVDDDGNPCFQRLVSHKTHKYTMRLRKEFVEEAGIKNKRVITIKDLEGREWLVELFVEKYQSIKYILSSGWSIFREYNELSDGDVCLFKFIKKEGVLALTQLIKNTNPRKQENRVKKARGEDGGVHIEEESGPEMEVVKRKRGRPSLESCRGDGVEVKTEESTLESYNRSNRVIYF